MTNDDCGNGDCKTTYQETTRVARAAVDSDPVHGSITPPLYLSSNYSFEGYNKKRAYDYSRSGNPTRDMLAKAIAELEGGFHAVVTSSGMSALDTVFQLLGKDDLLLAPHDCYGGTHRLLSHRAAKGHFRVKFADLTNPATLEQAFAEKVTLVLIETPSNPLLRITNIRAVATRAQQDGALVAVDNTFLSPTLQKPISLGADIVVHSTTKYINGHSDVVGGAIVSKTQELHQKLAWLANCVGTTGAPFDSFLTLRGLRTLPLRIKHQEQTAAQIARFLSQHPAVGRVYYPGLETHPGHLIAKQQQSGFGAMLSFELAAGFEKLPVFLELLTAGEGKLFSLAESLGGFESLIAHPATMTHASMDPDARRAAGIGDNLLRVSVGLEDAADLQQALSQALDVISASLPQQDTKIYAG
jgi:cystathionine gamma-synthase